MFGLNTSAGRLGTGDKENLYSPAVVRLPEASSRAKGNGNRRIIDVALGSQTSFVLTEEECD